MDTRETDQTDDQQQQDDAEYDTHDEREKECVRCGETFHRGEDVSKCAWQERAARQPGMLGGM